MQGTQGRTIKTTLHLFLKVFYLLIFYYYRCIFFFTSNVNIPFLFLFFYQTICTNIDISFRQCKYSFVISLYWGSHLSVCFFVSLFLSFFFFLLRRNCPVFILLIFYVTVSLIEVYIFTFTVFFSHMGIMEIRVTPLSDIPLLR